MEQCLEHAQKISEHVWKVFERKKNLVGKCLQHVREMFGNGWPCLEMFDKCETVSGLHSKQGQTFWKDMGKLQQRWDMFKHKCSKQHNKCATVC